MFNKRILYSLYYIIAISFIGMGISEVIFPLYLRDNNISPEQIGLTLSIGAFFFQILKIITATLSDFYSKRLFLLLSGIGKAILYPLIATRKLIDYIVAINALYDSVFSLGRAVDVVYVIEITPEKIKGKILGRAIGFMVLGYALGNFLSGILYTYFQDYFMVFVVCGLLALTEFMVSLTLPKIKKYKRFSGKIFLKKLFSYKQIPYLIKIWIIAGFFIGVGEASVISVALPLFLKEKVGLSLTMVGFISSLNIFSFGICSLLFGYLADKYKPGYVFSRCILLSGIMYLMLYTAETLISLVTFLTLSAVFYGIGWPGIEKIVAVTSSNDARLINIAWIGYYFGYTVGPYISGLLIQNIGYKVVFVFRGILFIATSAFIYLFLGKEDFQ